MMVAHMALEWIANAVAACHDWTKKRPEQDRPNLSASSTAEGSHPGFDIPPDKGESACLWDLFNFCGSPRSLRPGTKNELRGLPRPQDRLTVIAFLDASGHARQAAAGAHRRRR